ncbi:ATP-binding protein [Psychrosphaera aquimarina]|uniref:histidine kinase n=1 Tax=Psychrosphaera aquimarina TaxID=2044854 RepID=A0ABU3R127_9GAMM|nr:ATP-binding protein [Psychrosphaera aquimarina]MDU0113120.1 ATP-binding protein [Psychrosphaera aquimarina]
MQPSKSISRRLLVSVLSVYFILTFVVTCAQIYADYSNTKDYISHELRNLEKTFSASLTRAIWELNTPQVVSISEGLLEIPMVEGVLIRDDNRELLTQMGGIANFTDFQGTELSEVGAVISGKDGLFGYTFPLIFEFSGRTTQVGDVTLFSSREIVISRIMLSILFLIASAIIKTICLVVLFSIAFKKYLTKPLGELTEKIEKIDMENIDDAQIQIDQEEENELTVIKHSFNDLMAKVSSSQTELKHAQKQLVKTNDRLDQQNLMLEQEVAKKTANLSQAMMDLQKQKYQLETQQKTLKEEIETRRGTESKLLHQTTELEHTIETLGMAHGKLVESEKLAALGGLVAGITHDVNTPIGVGVTATSYLSDRLSELDKKFHDKSLSANDMKNFIDEGNQSIELLNNNLNRASELIASFKQIAVDQASEAIRTINLKEYLNEIITSLKPKLKKSAHEINIDCPDDIIMKVPAGAISQIFTNFLLNSVIHGFDGRENGQIDIVIKDCGDTVKIEYKDNGNGISKEQLNRLFDPFYTTKREQGGSGLGTNIAYNLVKQTLDGEIEAESELEKGLTYRLELPKVKKDPSIS